MTITSRESVAEKREDVSNRLDEFVGRLRESFPDHSSLQAMFDRHAYFDTVEYVSRHANRGFLISYHTVADMADKGKLEELARDAHAHIARERLAFEWGQFISKYGPLVRTIADERRRAKAA